eukprot:m51a1_g10223 putative 31 kda chloroplastic-like (319) ;mRNA; f:133615-134926
MDKEKQPKRSGASRKRPAHPTDGPSSSAAAVPSPPPQKKPRQPSQAAQRLPPSEGAKKRRKAPRPSEFLEAPKSAAKAPKAPKAPEAAEAAAEAPKAAEGEGIDGQAEQQERKEQHAACHKTFTDEGSETTRAYVGNLPFDLDDAGLAEVFAKAGVDVASARVSRRPHTNRSCGYGFVELAGGPPALEAAASALRGVALEGRELVVAPAARRDHAAPPAKRPRLADKRTVFVGGLPRDAGQREVVARIEELCEGAGAGRPESVCVPAVAADAQTLRGYALARFASDESAASAIAALAGAEVCGAGVTARVAKVGAPTQ